MFLVQSSACRRTLQLCQAKGNVLFLHLQRRPSEEDYSTTFHGTLPTQRSLGSQEEGGWALEPGKPGLKPSHVSRWRGDCEN